jgi:hypothetical protein
MSKLTIDDIRDLVLAADRDQLCERMATLSDETQVIEGNYSDTEDTVPLLPLHQLKLANWRRWSLTSPKDAFQHEWKSDRLPRCPTSRTSRPTRQWANGCPTARLPEWHSVASCDEIASPQRMGPPQKFDAPLGRGNSRAIRHSLFFMSANKGDPKHE